VENTRLKVENQLLRDEIARLKNLPPRPPFKPAGLDKATDATAEVIHYRYECWVTLDVKTIVAPLPAEIVGGYGPNLQRFCLMLHAQSLVTMERLSTL